MDLELIKLHGSNEKLMPFLHLPVQSGSNQILKKMNRKYNVDEYKKIIDQLKLYKPNIEISSDFIVGFPGETNNDFKSTLDLVEYVKFKQSYSFSCPFLAKATKTPHISISLIYFNLNMNHIISLSRIKD